MSTIVQFFIASREQAADALESGPESSLPILRYGNFDAEEALLHWESRITGATFESLLDKDLPLVVAEDGDGAFVFQLSAALLDSLASASPEQIHGLALWWTEQKATDGFQIDEEVAAGILDSLADLARQARESKLGVYCWTT